MKSGRLWIWLLLLVLIVIGVARLRFDIEILNLLPQNLAVAQGLKLYQQHFSDARELILTLEAPTAEEAESAAGAIAELLRAQTQAVSDLTWRPAWMEHPDQLTELIAFLWLNQPPARFAELTNRLAPANLTNVLSAAREQLATSLSPNELGLAGYDPYGLLKLPEAVAGAGPGGSTGEEFFATRDGTFRLMFVEAKPDLISYRSCRAWLAQIQGWIAEASASGKIPATTRIGYTGRPAFVTEIAGGMEKDMAGSSSGTLATIGILFWLTHRRLRPLFWLLTLLVVILAGTAALGGLFLGTVNVVSMGFACILLGLAEDFGIVIYQESRSHPQLNAMELRREVAPGICWSAVTTAGAFLILNLSVLPGLGQLGSLVAIGIILAAGLMLYGYMPPLLRMRRASDRESGDHQTRERFLLFAPRGLLATPLVWILTGLSLVMSIGLLATRGMHFDHSPNVLKPRHSQANAALEQIKTRFGRPQEPLWVLVPGRNETAVRRGLERVT
ncbi:MAG TPA: MMPL family transporter, partial [Candidatus Dormibacteraeota bacterium]|nr:MMPL family transporter [Candidatus Dormibacteraeota bacterium]